MFFLRELLGEFLSDDGHYRSSILQRSSISIWTRDIDLTCHQDAVQKSNWWQFLKVPHKIWRLRRHVGSCLSRMGWLCQRVNDRSFAIVIVKVDRRVLQPIAPLATMVTPALPSRMPRNEAVVTHIVCDRHLFVIRHAPELVAYVKQVSWALTDYAAVVWCTYGNLSLPELDSGRLDDRGRWRSRVNHRKTIKEEMSGTFFSPPVWVNNCSCSFGESLRISMEINKTP